MFFLCYSLSFLSSFLGIIQFPLPIFFQFFFSFFQFFITFFLCFIKFLIKLSLIFSQCLGLVVFEVSYFLIKLLFHPFSIFFQFFHLIFKFLFISFIFINSFIQSVNITWSVISSTTSC